MRLGFKASLNLILGIFLFNTVVDVVVFSVGRGARKTREWSMLIMNIMYSSARYYKVIISLEICYAFRKVKRHYLLDRQWLF